MTTLYPPLSTVAPGLRVARRDALAADPEVAVLLGEAPDGLPLVLHVVRRGSIKAVVLNALGNPERLAPDVESGLEQLEAAIAREARSAGIESVDDVAVYRTNQSIGPLFGPPLLARILGSDSPVVLAEDRYLPSSRPDYVPHTAAVANAPHPVTLMKGLKTRRHVAVPLRPGPVFLAEPALNGHADGASGAIDPESLEPLRFEDLRPLPTAWWSLGRDERGRFAEGLAYQRALRSSAYVSWGIGSADVVRLIAQVARSLQAFHDEGRVHADVKPANTVVTASGAVAIDPIGVAAGRVSPGITPSWAAPEQILAQPVVPGTDVYALALMLALLLRAAIYGEERSFLVPVGGSERRRVRVLADPEVFIDPTVVPLDDDGREAWADVLRQCVAFDPDDRPLNAAAFADVVEQLIEDFPLAWDLPTFRGGPGDLKLSVEIDSVIQPAWVVTDWRT
jgi:protein kinase-like protein